MKFWWQRLRQSYYLTGLAIGVALVLLHVLLVMVPDTAFLNGVRVDHISLSEWIGFNGSQQFALAFFLILPLTASLGVGLILLEDLTSGFSLRVLGNTRIHYLPRLLTLTFLDGFMTGALPLAIDAFFAVLYFPNLAADLVLNRSLINPKVTFFSALAFHRPLQLMIVYILIVGCGAGLFALMGCLFGAVFQNVYLALAGPLIVTLILTVAAEVFPKVIVSPDAVIAPMSPNFLPEFRVVVIGFIVSLIAMIRGITSIAKAKTQI